MKEVRDTAEHCTVLVNRYNSVVVTWSYVNTGEAQLRSYGTNCHSLPPAHSLLIKLYQNNRYTSRLTRSVASLRYSFLVGRCSTNSILVDVHFLSSSPLFELQTTTPVEEFTA